MAIFFLIVMRVVELTLLAACLFVLPRDRIEYMIVDAAAVVWVAVRNQTIQLESRQLLMSRPVFQVLRALFARFDRQEDRIDDALMIRDFDAMQREVGIENTAVLSAKYEHLRKPVSLRMLRQGLEQEWFDSLIRIHRTTYVITIESLSGLCRLALIGWAIVLLV
jgi:hypothetical protein